MVSVTAIFLRALDNNGAIYFPYEFTGDEWTDEEMAVVKTVIDSHVPERIDAMFSNWRFVKRDYGFMGWRFTWEMGSIGGKTVVDLADDLAKYYNQ